MYVNGVALPSLLCICRAAQRHHARTARVTYLKSSFIFSLPSVPNPYLYLLCDKPQSKVYVRLI